MYSTPEESEFVLPRSTLLLKERISLGSRFVPYKNLPHSEGGLNMQMAQVLFSSTALNI